MPHADPLVSKEYQKEYSAEHSEKKTAYAREWRKANPNAHWASNLKKYGLTIDEYYEMEQAQDYRCAICHTNEPGGRGRWHVDHDHDTGKVRGLLCIHCNLGLGHFKDSPTFLDAAIRYLDNNL
jgi:hypothetical protein